MELTLAHKRQVECIALAIYRKIGFRIPVEDLYQYGYIGLINAFNNWDPTKGVFSTYADHKIRGAILDGIRKETKFRSPQRGKAAESRTFVSLNTEDESIEPVWLKDSREIHTVEFEREDENAHYSELLWKAIALLPARELAVMLSMILEEKNMREIGEAMGFSVSRISQIHASAVRKIKTMVATA